MIRRLFFALAVLSAYPALSCGSSPAVFEPTPGVLLQPLEADVVVGETQQFTATIQVDTSGLAWSVDGGDTFGTVDANGLYTAPSVVPAGGVATVRAKLNDDNSTQATSQVNILAAP